MNNKRPDRRASQAGAVSVIAGKTGKKSHYKLGVQSLCIYKLGRSGTHSVRHQLAPV